MADITYKGIALPTFENPYPNLKEERDLIRDSVITILMTKKGQRFFVPDFGSRLWEVLFEPNTTVTQVLAERYIKEALTTWEPRVEVLRVDAASEENSMYLRVVYRIKRINEIYELKLDISRDNFTSTLIQ